MSHALAWAAGGTGFTFLMTTLGAAMVFFFRKAVSANIQRIFLGFAAGVMIAASVWSLLIPAMEEAQAAGVAGWLPAGGGFVLGVAFLMLLDSLLPHLHPGCLLYTSLFPVHIGASRYHEGGCSGGHRP